MDVKEQQNERKEKQDNQNKACTSAMHLLKGQDGIGMRGGVLCSRSYIIQWANKMYI
jgi:hypothetical protein